jgi:triacylglycerol esterase/lipase EstA (alpha/beta hydrolase family)
MYFLADFASRVISFKEGGSVPGSVIFVIGQALVGQVDNQTIFGCFAFSDQLACAKFAIEFYQAQILACRRAVDAWTVVGTHVGVVKDVRKIISRLIWESRKEALFKEV